MSEVDSSRCRRRARAHRRRGLGARACVDQVRWTSTRRCTSARSRIPRASGPSMAEEYLYWHKKWDKVLDWEFDTPRVEWFKGGKTNVAYNCVDRHLTTWRRNKAALIWESRRGPQQDLHVPVALLQGVPLRQRAQEARHQEGRPRRDLPADDPGARRSSCSRARASARSTRSSSAASPRSRCATASRTAAARCSSPPTRASAAAASIPLKADGRRGAARVPDRRDRHRRLPRPQTASTWSRAATSGTTRRSAPTDIHAPLRHRVDGRRGPALHPLHVRLDRQAEGRAPHHRRLPALRDDDVQVHVRLPRRGRLLLHRRHRLGHRPQLRRLRPAVRSAPRRSCSRASRPTRTPAASGQIIEKHGVNQFYTAPTAIRALMKVGRGVAGEVRSLEPARPRHGRRADQPRGVDVVLQEHRPRARSRSSTRGGRPRPAAT